MEHRPLVKQNMAALRRDILPVSPFAMLSEEFSQEIRERFVSGEGMYRLVDLELLRELENEAAQSGGGETVNLEIQLKLVLERRKERGDAPAAERILQKVGSIRIQREKTAQSQTVEGPQRKTWEAVPMERRRESGFGGGWPVSQRRETVQWGSAYEPDRPIKKRGARGRKRPCRRRCGRLEIV